MLKFFRISLNETFYLDDDGWPTEDREAATLYFNEAEAREVADGVDGFAEFGGYVPDA